MKYFSAQNLKQTLPNFTLNLSFECEKNSMTCILGPSGSGKTTILRLLSGLNKSENNEQKIFLDGEDISKLKPYQRHIGMVFQDHTLFNHLSVVDNVSYGLISMGIKKKQAQKQAEEFLKYFNLENFAKRSPEKLSGGEAQRVALARTLIVKPKLILFDEPLSALDAPLRKKSALLIKELQNKFNFTGIMVTHDIEEAKAISDKIITIDKGKIIWQGKAEDYHLTLF